MGTFFHGQLNAVNVFGPMILGFPAWLYIWNIKCSRCGARVYTGDHLRSSGRGIVGWLLLRFRNCPECHTEL